MPTSATTTIGRFSVDELDKCEQAIRSDGAVCLTGLFSADMVAKLVQEHDKVLAELDAKMVGVKRKEAPYLGTIAKDLKKEYTQQGYWDLGGDDKVLDVGKGRLDFTYLMDTGIFGDPNFHAPPAIAELARRLLRTDYAHYVGAVPSREKSDVGFWHRDTYSFFDDESIDMSVPPFYLTVLVPLNEITEELGPTQLRLGSHRCTLEEAEKCPLAVACPMQPGDALVFDGRCVHRGLANGSSELRRMLYVVWHKKWYNDYSEFQFAPGFSVCDPCEDVQLSPSKRSRVGA